MKRVNYIFCLLVFILGCKDTTDDLPINNGNGNGAQDPEVGVQLIFPFEGSLCNEGTNITPTESTVNFEWIPNDNALSYKLSVQNLDTDVITEYITEDFILPITIERSQAYRWVVEYDIQEETKTSAIWNFYNAGPGEQTYAPFPAEILSPTMAENLASTTSITLQWSGSDVDDDIIGYDVYFGTESSPTLNTSDMTSNQLTVAVAPGSIYYWEIVTKDAEGNTSESGVYQFRILE
ncbi:hypothetical protein [uncultured Winogradskyella sp.]|uniref:hypothetical protein n=1 Tax=uncultured Winogradskyella sp. TaxID=395353 RepID=UPI0026117C81|nr:hypothetical protein [uncultured Winogradskyella sp.]